jgi:hypothetical protein
MGKIKCPIHGLQGFYEVCDHIWESFQNEIFPQMKELPTLSTKICKQCYENNNVEKLGKLTIEDLFSLPKTQQIIFEEKVSSIYDNLNRKIKCIECINSIRLIEARKKGVEIPFEPYENTLMHKDHKIVESLRNILNRTIESKKFRKYNLKSENLFHLKSGGISYPLSIKFYYITEKEDQEKLLKQIEDFFKDIPQKQRQVRFYESENWITKKDQYGILKYKGDETILFEDLIR